MESQELATCCEEKGNWPLLGASGILGAERIDYEA